MLTPSSIVRAKKYELHSIKVSHQPGARLRHQTEDGNVIHVDFTKQK